MAQNAMKRRPNQIGFRELERHQSLTPPARFWFGAEPDSKTYRPIAGATCSKAAS
jgi:hypothetical protein